MMKLSLLIIVFLCAVSGVRGQERMIRFESSSDLASVFEKAKRENKLVFVDGYTQWCERCKEMEKKVFVQDSVIRFFNEHFVNVQLDMGKGEGEEMAKKLDIQSFPVYLFMDAAGNVRHEAIGYREAIAFIAEGQRALDPERCLAGLEKRYENSDRTPSFILDYALTLMRANKKKYTDIAYLYLDVIGLRERYATGDRDVELMEQYARILDTLQLFGDLQKFAPEYLAVIPKERMTTTRNWQWLEYYASNRFSEAIRKVALDPSFFAGVAGGIEKVNDLVTKAVKQETYFCLFASEATWDKDKVESYVRFLHQIDLPVTRECLFQLSNLICLHQGDYAGLLRLLEEKAATEPFVYFPRERYFRTFWEAFLKCRDQQQVERSIAGVERLIREEQQEDWKEQWVSLREKLQAHLVSLK